MTLRIEGDDKQQQAQGKGGQCLGAVELLVADQQGDDLDGDRGDRLKGLTVRFAARPAAMTTIIVSPIARDTASRMPPTIPGRAAGTPPA